MSFADLKKQSRAGSLTDKLIKKVEKLIVESPTVTTVSGNLKSIRQVTVTP